MIFVFIFLALWPSIAWDWRFVVTLLYGIALGFGLLVILATVRKLSLTAERLLFLGFGILSVVKTILYDQTGLHLNGFVLSMLFEFSRDDFSDFFSEAWSVLLSLSVMGVISLWFGYSIRHFVMTVPAKALVIVAFIGLLFSEALSAHFYLSGDPRAIQLRQTLAYHIPPHPYYLKKIAKTLGISSAENPFSASLNLKQNQTDQPENAFTIDPSGPIPNIVLVIADSLRSADIKRNPALMTSLTNDPSVIVDLDHSSISNCTHFSYYTLFNGDYPTGFSAARAGSVGSALVNALDSAGYSIQNFESRSLDWYDTRRFIFGRDTPTFEANGGPSADTDAAAVDATINALRNANSPYFLHLYLYNTHWPYWTDGDYAAPQESYEAAINGLDRQLEKLKGAIRAVPVEKRPVLIITSDHGEETGSSLGHGSALNDNQTRVPFAVMPPPDVSLPAFFPKSHLAFGRYLTSLMNGVDFESPKSPAIEMSCSYDYPDAFRVTSAKGEFHFSLTNGVLEHTKTTTIGISNPAGVKPAFTHLLRTLKPLP